MTSVHAALSSRTAVPADYLFDHEADAVLAPETAPLDNDAVHAPHNDDEHALEPDVDVFSDARGPRLHQSVFDRMISNDFHPYAAQVVLGPTADAQAADGAAVLRRAFNNDAPFDDAALRVANIDGAEGRQMSRAASLEGRKLPRGFTIKLNGDMPLDSRARLAHVLGGANAALGTSFYDIEALPEQFKAGGGDAAIQRKLNEMRESLPHLMSPEHRVALVRASDALNGDHYALVVTANDVPAAHKLWQYASARAASDSPLTVHALAQSAEYRTLHERAQCARDTIAAQWARAARLELADGGTADSTSPHYTLLPSQALAHNATHERKLRSAGAYEAPVYVLHHNTTPTAHSRQQAVVLRHGLMGGVTLIENTAVDRRSWTVPKFLSAVPAQTPELSDMPIDAPDREFALHRKSDARSSAAFDARVVWHTDKSAAALHPASDERHAALSDKFSQHWLRTLSGDAKLSHEHYHFVAGQLPDESSLHASIGELARETRRANAPPTMVVALAHPLVARMTQLWDDVVKPSGYAAEIEQVLENKFDDDQRDGFGALSRASVCTDANHAHNANAQFNEDESSGALQLYTDAERFNISPLTGNYVGSAGAVNSAAAAVDAPAAINELRRKLAPSTRAAAAASQRTMLTLDSQLIRMLTTESEQALESQ